MGGETYRIYGRRQLRLRRGFHFRHSLCLLVLLLAFTVAADKADTDTADSAAGMNSNEEVLEVVTSIEVDLPANKVHVRRKKTSVGVDEQDLCADWAAEGECEANPDYMLENCAASCIAIGNGDNEDDEDEDGAGERRDEIAAKKGMAFIYKGEDAAIGAFRFAEQYASHYENEVIPTSTVLHIARELQHSLATSPFGPDYIPSVDVTHCGGESKSRLCSAGKLWKRAEEMRKAELYDAAGADLIRALLKSGTEVDFVEKCERSLQWAFLSVRKQREQERKLALEEAKLEKRRKEEMEAMAEAAERKRDYEASFVKFGKGLEESLVGRRSEASVGADGSLETTSTESQTLITNVIQTFTETGPQGGNWSKTLQLIRKIPPSDKTVDVLLVEARCHEMEGNHKQALSAAGKLIAKAANHEPWLNDSPRMMATTLGSNAAMQLGLSENAISFYQNVLKFDPEQERARKQYRGLKKVVKLLEKAEEQIQKGYNNAASEFVTESLSAMRGLDVDSPLFRSKIQLKRCTILSNMGKYEEALENCDQAVELRLANESVVSVESRKEAHLARAEALLLDMDYDEAVSDLRAAFDLCPEDKDHMQEKRQLQQKLQQAMHQQKLWNGGEKDYRFNENTGYPDGRPPERDHAKILQLPIDLDQRTKDIKCAWLKKQFKALVRQYHPDKYKGNKKRAARKFKEVKEAKEIISSAWEC
jgi:tetratricopeptide (TPR) repeat protein